MMKWQKENWQWYQKMVRRNKNRCQFDASVSDGTVEEELVLASEMVQWKKNWCWCRFNNGTNGSIRVGSMMVKVSMVEETTEIDISFGGLLKKGPASLGKLIQEEVSTDGVTLGISTEAICIFLYGHGSVDGFE